MPKDQNEGQMMGSGETALSYRKETQRLEKEQAGRVRTGAQSAGMLHGELLMGDATTVPFVCPRLLGPGEGRASGSDPEPAGQ